jgi:endoglucanase
MNRLLLLLLTLMTIGATHPTAEIKVDQVGYLPEAPKMAMVVTAGAATNFTICRADNGAVAFQGKLTEPVADADSGDRVQIADFTKLQVSGRYYMDVPGIGRSWDFAIQEKVYSKVFYLAMRSFYGQRCGTAIDLGAEFSGYKHAACHLEGAYHPSSGKSGAQLPAKGWHDAGDYGRYVVNSGLSTGTLLWTWELFGARMKGVTLNIPESKNGTPDMLNEIRWNLDWLLSMQDADGGVWQKQTSEQFCAFVMPEQDKTVSYIIGIGKEPYKSSGASADFAAVMAIAARVYKPFDARYAQKALGAAQRAWSWLEKNPQVLFRNPSGISTGEYGDRNCGDERLWAAAELWRTTGDRMYERYFLEHFKSFMETLRPQGPQSWSNVAPVALWAYVLGRGKDSAAVAEIRQATVKAADEIVARSTRNGYRHSLISREYIWGSNGVVANYGMQLLIANAMAPDARYVQAALENLHYLLGRNPFSLSWVTRVGAHPFRHPHHRPSAADQQAEPWPGLLSGGPNHSRQDSAMKKLPDLPPAKMYLDEEESYATNEVAINWNAPLVFLLAGVLEEKR